MNKEQLIQGTVQFLKEFGRVVLIAVIPFLIIQLENGSIDIRAVLLVGVIAFLRALDRALHETAEGKLSGGLTRF